MELRSWDVPTNQGEDLFSEVQDTIDIRKVIHTSEKHDNRCVPTALLTVLKVAGIYPVGNH